MCRARRSPGRRGKSPAEPAPVQTAALDPPEQQESDGEECASLVFSEQESVNDTEECSRCRRPPRSPQRLGGVVAAVPSLLPRLLPPAAGVVVGRAAGAAAGATAAAV